MFKIYGKYTQAIVYSDICENDALSQIFELCNHPIFKGASIRIMPDVHAGKGCTVGTTIRTKGGAVMPSIVGADVGCGVLTVIFSTDSQIDYAALDSFILRAVPTGMSIRESTHPCMQNTIKRRVRELCERLEMYKSESAFLRSCGTLGGGNHYIEIGRLSNGNYALTIHTGSRSLGKCIAEYYSDVAKNYLHSSGITGVNRSLPFVEGDDYKDYVSDMLVATEFAAENRRLIAYDVLNFIGASELRSFDTVHNYIEPHRDGSITIRKGAIRAEAGEEVAIPLNMRDGVLVCLGKGNPEWNCSAPHGAGRLLSRSEAKATVSLAEYEESMKGIYTWSVGTSTLDESPMAYKPAETIIEQIAETAEIIDVIKPLYNFKARSLSGR